MAKKEKVTKQFELGDISNKTKISQAVSDLNDHINEQEIEADVKKALRGMADKFTERITGTSSHLLNVAMISNAVNTVNQYL